eukprot:7370286-Pyramimonas_sp.AAC.1
MANYMRAFLCEALHGGWSDAPVVEYGEEQMPFALLPDYRSLCDHVKTDYNIPDDRCDAAWLAALESHVSCGPQRDGNEGRL